MTSPAITIHRAWERLSFLWRYQIVFWGAYLICLSPVHFIGFRYIFGWDVPLHAIVVMRLVDTVVMILMTQAFGWSLESRAFRRQGIARTILWICIGAILIVVFKSTVIRSGILHLYGAFGEFQPKIGKNEFRFAHYSYSFLQYAGWGGIFVFSKRAGEARQRECQLREAKAKHREAEILMLRSQLDPTFLANALKVLATESAENPNAGHLLAAITDYLQYSLANRDRLFVPLAEELRATESYIGVEIRRFGRRLTHQIRIDPSSVRVPVPGILIQPLVENAILHNRRPDGSLHLELDCRYGSHVLAITLRTAGSWSPRNEAAYHANLSKLRERLALLYPGRADLDATRNDTGTTVGIRIREPESGDNLPNSPASRPTGPPGPRHTNTTSSIGNRCG